ncbi:MAG: MBL fold metallo-hydrolase [Planctomycetes bacterium]|nr:MBL fold metallo-hydrolase [Planctomycetota bacterium]
MNRRTLELAPHRITALSDGRFALDGGAMFGVVPRVLWQRSTPVDESHRIPLALRPFLIETGGRKLLVEPGIGERWSERERSMYAIDHSGHAEDDALAVTEGRAGDVVASLAELGIAPDAIDVVVLTHGHWDHAGSVVRAVEGELVPTFPNARVVIPAVEWRAAQDPEHVRRGSYRTEDLAPLHAAGLLEPVVCDAIPHRHEVVPGVSLTTVGGHSEGVSIVEVEGTEAKAVFWSDVVPTSMHVHPAWIMAYDMNAELSYAVRKPLIERAAQEGWIALYYHDHAHAFGRFVADGKRIQHGDLESERLTPFVPR